MKQKEYVEDEGKSLVQLMLVVIFVVAGVIFVVSGILLLMNNDEDRKLRVFVASQYNFTEEECAEWNVQDRARPDCVCDAVDRPCCEVRECSRYCHTEQKQVGEECKTTQKLNIDAIEKSCWINETTGRAICIESLGNFSGIIVMGKNLVITPLLFNETFCIPVYETKIIEGTCRTGDEVRKARELVK